MGKLIYEGSVNADFDDRVLAHLQAVIGNKLRRKEAFYLTWRDDLSIGGGRTSVWVHPDCNLVFKYHGGRKPTLNSDWLEAFMFTANSQSGLYVVPEPAAAASVDSAQHSE